MKKLDRFIIMSFGVPFLATLGIVVFILAMQFLWLYIDELVGKGLGFKVILEFMMWGSCQVLPLAIPLATLLSSMMALGDMGEKFELTAIKASGISLTRVLAPMTIICLLICVGAFYVGDRLVPYAINQIYTMRDDIRRTKSEIKIPTGIFYDGIDGYILRVERRNKETGMMYNIQVYDHSSSKGNTRITVADSGIIKMSKVKDYLTFSMYDGVSYQEENTRKYKDTTLTLQRVAFARQEMVISLENYSYHQSDSARYGEQVRSMNLKSIHNGRDSLETLVYNGTRRHVDERKTKGLRKRNFRRQAICHYRQQPGHGVVQLYPPYLPYQRRNLEEVRPGSGLPAALLHRCPGGCHPQEGRSRRSGHYFHAVLRPVLGH